MTHDAEAAPRSAPDPRAGRPTRTSPALLQRRLRQLHLYISMVFAPSLAFFAATGALQLFDLHEAKPGRAFEPPAILEELGMVHKKQVFALPRRRSPPPGLPDGGAPAPGAPAPERGRGEGWSVLALKVFFLFASVGLLASTGLGVWIGLQPGRNRRTAVGLLLAGTAVPILLLAL
ncbi:PepSY domain-containing protein [Lichenibacterium minor]|uniref:PepSY domain-containing protein n=1 Tax=Lichenibacterium minor TaxID=2316528 RepID=A0A4V1RV72_9HYPH|nr:PepSY domain-containing protein [Lichenibacterium minor]RYC33644.1 PepSY domain-containing protein [Lichenibacterium minor]